ncbi:hypothetical protein [Boudabousia tangfeifanii]|nr:hypothetical protein [Boudabousia tangfeifanii]
MWEMLKNIEKDKRTWFTVSLLSLVVVIVFIIWLACISDNFLKSILQSLISIVPAYFIAFAIHFLTVASSYESERVLKESQKLLESQRGLVAMQVGQVLREQVKSAQDKDEILAILRESRVLFPITNESNEKVSSATELLLTEFRRNPLVPLPTVGMFDNPLSVNYSPDAESFNELYKADFGDEKVIKKNAVEQYFLTFSSSNAEIDLKELNGFLELLIHREQKSQNNSFTIYRNTHYLLEYLWNHKIGDVPIRNKLEGNVGYFIDVLVCKHQESKRSEKDSETYWEKLNCFVIKDLLGDKGEFKKEAIDFLDKIDKNLQNQIKGIILDRELFKMYDDEDASKLLSVFRNKNGVD